MSKKIISVLLTLVMAISVVLFAVSCSSGKQEETTTSKTEQSNTTAKTTEDTTSEETVQTTEEQTTEEQSTELTGREKMPGKVIVQTYNKDNTDKGTYTADKQSIYIGNYRFIEDITRDKLQRRMNNLDDETLRKATLNVLNHEIGHALQTSFKGKYGYNDTKYNQLIQNLCTKYPNEFKLQATDESLSPNQQGMIPKSRKDSKEQNKALKQQSDSFCRPARPYQSPFAQ